MPRASIRWFIVLLLSLLILAGSVWVGWQRLSLGRSEPSARRHELEMRGFRFEPAELRVAAGDTIVWINRDLVPHTATSVSAWDTGKVDPNATGFVVARGEGEQSYTCTYHPNMKAKLVVR